MKWKKVSSAALAAMLLLLFLPVFFCVIFLGNNMNYNEAHKIVTLEGNKVLLLCAVLGGAVVCGGYLLLRRISYNRRSVVITAVATACVCILFYFFNAHVSKCIAFYGGWDCGMVANSATWLYEGSGLGYGDYYTIYSNNVPITWLLYRLYCVAAGWAGYPYNVEFIWIQFQCVMLSLAVFAMVMTVLIISRKIGAAVATLLMGCVFLGLSPWKVIPYTDGCSIAFPVIVIFLYALFLQWKSRWRYGLWFLALFLGAWGGIMKATVYVSLIAVVAIELAWTFFASERFLDKVKKLVLKIGLLLCAFLLASCCKQGMYKAVNYQYDYDMEIGWSNYLYNGLKEETTGACYGEGLELVRTFAGESREVRNKYELAGIKSRMSEKGFVGLIDFWLRKQVMNYNDGTFSWYQEGYFDAWAYEDIVDSSWEKPLQSFYWQEGENYLWFTTLSQGIWLFVLLGVILEAAMLLWDVVGSLRKQPSAEQPSRTELSPAGMAVRTVSVVTFIGIFLFVMLFEARARYLYNMTPIFLLMAVMGYCGLAEKMADNRIICKKNRTEDL